MWESGRAGIEPVPSAWDAHREALPDLLKGQKFQLKPFFTESLLFATTPWLSLGVAESVRSGRLHAVARPERRF